MEATSIAQLRNSVQILAGTYNKEFTEILICTVDDNAKAESDFIIDCTPISGKSTTKIEGVKLNAEANDGLMIIPSKGSTVLVATTSRNKYYVLLYSDIDKIIGVIDSSNSFEFSSSGWVWNDGTNGGLVKVNALLTKINQLETFENKVLIAIAAIASAGASSPGVPVTNATLAAFMASITPTTPIVPTTLTELEDVRIKH